MKCSTCSKEIWKDIEGYKGLYQVSNLGRIKSLTRMIRRGRGWYMATDRMLKPHIHITGYCYTCLKKANKGKRKLIHRLVAQTFVSNSSNKPYVNHIDGNKENNHADNLEWCTHYENIEHSIKTGLRKSSGKWSNVKGVYWDKTHKHWRAKIRNKGKETYLGVFHSELDACQALKGYKQL